MTDRPSPRPDRPNVLVILSDQHRADLMGCAGRGDVPTPHIDGIADAGVRFRRAYCPYPVCAASRMSLLTGRWAHDHGVIRNTDTLDWRARTVAHHFASAGYQTGLIGKMHFNDANTHGFGYHVSINDWLAYLGPKVRLYANEIANHPIAPGFFDTVNDDGSGFPEMTDLWEGPSPWAGQVERTGFDSMASKMAAEDHLDAFLARQVVRFLRRHRDGPFFLVAAFMNPHPPFYPPAHCADRYPPGRTPLPPVGDVTGYPAHIQRRIKYFQDLGPERLRAHRAGYYGNLAFLDECVGIVLEALAGLGLADDTLLVYASDHGEMDGDHGLYQKFCLLEPAVRVPLIVSWPGRLPRGRTCDALTQYAGLYATLAELTGTAPAGGAEIAGFADRCLDPDAPGPEAVFAEYDIRSPLCQYMVRTDRFKYVHNDGGSGDELYDHHADPDETVNLAEDPAHRGVRDEMHDRLIAWYEPLSNPHRPPRT